MSTEALAAAVANRMKNGADSKKYRVYESSFAGEREVFASENVREVAEWLKANGAFRAPVVMDGGYHVSTPTGGVLFQGSVGLDNWIKASGG